MAINLRKRRLIKTAAAAIGILLLIIAWGFPALKREMIAVNCRSQMRSIGFAGRIWAEDNDGRFPSNFVTMSNEINNPQILICPGDTFRHRAADFSSLKDENSSYEIVNPGVSEGMTNQIFIRCKVHGYVVYADGRVFTAPQTPPK